MIIYKEQTNKRTNERTNETKQTMIESKIYIRNQNKWNNKTRH